MVVGNGAGRAAPDLGLGRGRALLVVVVSDCPAPAALARPVPSTTNAPAIWHLLAKALERGFHLA